MIHRAIYSSAACGRANLCVFLPKTCCVPSPRTLCTLLPALACSRVSLRSNECSCLYTSSCCCFLIIYLGAWSPSKLANGAANVLTRPHAVCPRILCLSWQFCRHTFSSHPWGPVLLSPFPPPLPAGIRGHGAQALVDNDDRKEVDEAGEDAHLLSERHAGACGVGP